MNKYFKCQNAIEIDATCMKHFVDFGLYANFILSHFYLYS